MSTLRTDVLKDVAETIAVNIVDIPAAIALRADLANIADPAKGAGQIGRGNQVVSNIVALKGLLKTSASKAVFVNGYYVAGDGGGGYYYLDEADVVTADNGGTVIVATDGGRWKLKQVSPVTFKQFGAKGDGVDDTTALANGAANGASHFPSGTYITSTAVAVPSNVHWTADKGAILKLKNASDSSVIVNSDTVGGNSDIIIEGLEVDGNKANQGAISRPALLFKKATRATIRNCKVHDAKITTYTTDTFDQILFVDSNDCIVERCESYNSDQGGLGFYGTGGGHKLLFNYVHDCPAGIEGAYQTDSHVMGNKVTNSSVSLISWSGLRNIIYKNTVENSSAAAGIVCGHSGTPDQIADQSYVTENIIKDVFSYGVTVFASADVTVQANKITRVAGDSTNSIFINTGCTRVQVLDNFIYDYQTSAGGACGIFIDGCSEAIVRGNKVYGAKGNTTGQGIRLFNSCPDSQVVNNTVVDSTGNGINISEAASINCTISGNQVKTAGGIGIRTGAIGFVVSGNHVSGVSGAQGILIAADQGCVTGNRVSGVVSGSGIFLNAIDYNSVVGNVIDNCSIGINVPSGTDNSVEAANVMTATVTTKISVGTVSGNKVAHNIGSATHDV